ncbi:hypothetical protein GWE18_16875 [Bradyrhizobium sp. CSA112]|uniref:hypothetical protein n=1 Tax=Bradyrhizobium sp. CSA112 TaxID=2699170 RepID=UPI0023B0BC28|nr:hypothetical protein [Bradyrhizobium sp. CSA112]MDE5454482.1 hypothetical protein [Bradyrhizobium sp. CSA112]
MILLGFAGAGFLAHTQYGRAAVWGTFPIAQESRLQELADIKLALAVLAVQFPDDAAPDKNFAQRAVLAMKNLGS